MALAALAGSLMIALLLRLALAAPGWVSEAGQPAADPPPRFSTSSGDRCRFLVAAIPIVVALAQLAARPDPAGRSKAAPLTLLRVYPPALAAAGLALIAAGFVTECRGA